MVAISTINGDSWIIFTKTFRDVNKFPNPQKFKKTLTMYFKPNSKPSQVNNLNKQIKHSIDKIKISKKYKHKTNTENI